MSKPDRIKIRPYFAFEEQGESILPRLSIEVNGRVLALRSSVEIEGRILDHTERTTRSANAAPEKSNGRRPGGLV